MSPIVRTIENTQAQRTGQANRNSHGAGLKGCLSISRELSCVSIYSQNKTAGRYPYAPSHFRSFGLAVVGRAQEKAPVLDAGTTASHDMTQASQCL